jgi:hypothetical protein
MALLPLYYVLLLLTLNVSFVHSDVINDVLKCVTQIGTFNYILIDDKNMKKVSPKTKKKLVSSEARIIIETSKLKHQNNNILSKLRYHTVSTIIILNADNLDDIHDKMIDSELDSSVTYLVFSTIPITSSYFSSLKLLRFDSKFFLVQEMLSENNNTVTYSVTSLYKVAKMDDIIHVENCGTWSTNITNVAIECTLNRDVILTRRNLFGISLKISYDDWQPYSILGPDGVVNGGVFYDILEELKMSLNFTTE